MGCVLDPSPGLSGIAIAKQGRVSRATLIGSRQLLETRPRSEWVWLGMVGPMIRRVNTQFVVLVLFFFTLCQVMGTVCPLPDLSVAEGAALLVEEGMACPMDGTTMCPSSLTSSPERQIMNSLASGVDHATTLLDSAAALTFQCTPTLLSVSSACSMVPISISSSSVLRI